MFYRERGAKAYGPLSYWFSSWFLQLPMVLLNVLIFSVIVYNMVGFTDADGHFGCFFITMMLTSWTGLFTCQMMAALASTAQAAINFFPVSLFITVAFGGYIVYIPSFALWIRVWAPYLSFLRYAFQALTLNEMRGNPDLDRGEDFIEELGFDTIDRDTCVGLILLFTAFFATALLLALKYINYEER